MVVFMSPIHTKYKVFLKPRSMNCLDDMLAKEWPKQTIGKLDKLPRYKNIQKDIQRVQQRLFQNSIRITCFLRKSFCLLNM